MISGSPGLNERVNNPLPHHNVRDFRTQLEVDVICRRYATHRCSESVKLVGMVLGADPRGEVGYYLPVRDDSLTQAGW
ncbi:MAG TPA: hypothetical protein VMM76_28015 [Pirellulaceae bacterium]|nr:hypothetical protein [Pirellulaceae bacterium]